jgi:hypothetical protein
VADAGGRARFIGCSSDVTTVTSPETPHVDDGSDTTMVAWGSVCQLFSSDIFSSSKRPRSHTITGTVDEVNIEPIADEDTDSEIITSCIPSASDADTWSSSFTVTRKPICANRSRTGTSPGSGPADPDTSSTDPDRPATPSVPVGRNADVAEHARRSASTAHALRRSSIAHAARRSHLLTGEPGSGVWADVGTAPRSPAGRRLGGAHAVASTTTTVNTPAHIRSRTPSPPFRLRSLHAALPRSAGPDEPLPTSRPPTSRPPTSRPTHIPPTDIRPTHIRRDPVGHDDLGSDARPCGDDHPDGRPSRCPDRSFVTRP